MCVCVRARARVCVCVINKTESKHALWVRKIPLCIVTCQHIKKIVS